MTLKEKYEAKCKEAARYKADVRSMQDELAALRNVSPVVNRVEIVRYVDRRICVPAVDIARGMSGTNADKVKALEAALGVAVARLREAGLDANIKGLEWGSD